MPFSTFNHHRRNGNVEEITTGVVLRQDGEERWEGMMMRRSAQSEHKDRMYAAMHAYKPREHDEHVNALL